MPENAELRKAAIEEDDTILQITGDDLDSAIDLAIAAEREGGQDG